ncbi:transcriptional regulator FnrL [Oceaniglobus indicus]|uniref:transcriptional regulator FnrL n=1 Tax=Oceaniglobus indicus TaxID=2047749 RepID=UPI000C18AF97|nr:Crp/Fnr family transcriptional regulator [Oceaniglobus indicus]
MTHIDPSLADLTRAGRTLAGPGCSQCPIRHRAICATCEDSELDRLEGMKSYHTWRAGETIVMEGADLAFVGSVVSGCATLTRSMEDGRMQMVGLLMPSDFIGRNDRAVAAYEVVAATDVTFCMFRRAEFRQMMRETPHVMERMLEMSLDELDAARDWMIVLGRKTAREKVATLLANILRRVSTQGSPLHAQLPLTRDAMATYLGLTIETVSRQMTALRKDGLIDLDGRRGISCRDLSALLAEAGDDEDGQSPA